MPHTKRDNYKAKWLDALANKQTPLNKIESKLESTIEDATSIALNASIVSQKLHAQLMETAQRAIDCIQIMDECTNVYEVEIAKVGQNIDMRLKDMSAPVICRRVRDVLQLACDRIAYQSISIERMSESLTVLSDKSQRLENKNRMLEDQIIDTFYIGQNGTSTERGELTATVTNKSEFNRFGVKYYDVEPTDTSYTEFQVRTLNNKSPPVLGSTRGKNLTLEDELAQGDSKDDSDVGSDDY